MLVVKWPLNKTLVRALLRLLRKALKLLNNLTHPKYNYRLWHNILQLHVGDQYSRHSIDVTQESTQENTEVSQSDTEGTCMCTCTTETTQEGIEVAQSIIIGYMA